MNGTDVVSRVDMLEVELSRLKYMIEAKTLHEYVAEELRRVEAIDEFEIIERLKKHEILKKQNKLQLGCRRPSGSA